VDCGAGLEIKDFEQALAEEMLLGTGTDSLIWPLKEN